MSDHKRTCQICGRLIGAKKGTIAHHGYRVSGFGFFMGSYELPFEISRDALGKHIVGCKAMESEKAARVAALSDPASADLMIVRTFKEGYGYRAREIRLSFTAATFDAVREENADLLRRYCGLYKWEELVQSEHRAMSVELERFRAYIDQQSSRYESWKQKEAA